MATVNPWTALRAQVFVPLTTWSVLVNYVGGARNIQLWSNPTDVRPDMDRSTEPKRIQAGPVGSSFDPYWSSGSARFVRRYSIEIFTRGLDVSQFEYIEWLIQQAYVAMINRSNPSNQATVWPNAAAIAPLIYDSLAITDTDPEREILSGDTADWTAVCDLVVTGHVTHQSILNIIFA